MEWVRSGSSPPDGPVLPSPAGSCGASPRTAACRTPPSLPPDGGSSAAPSRPPPPDHARFPPWPAGKEPSPSAAASSEITAARPEASREPPVSLPSRRHTTDQLHGCSTGAAQIPPPCAGSLPAATAPPEPDTSSPRAPRWRRRAPAAARSPEAVPPVPSAATPNSCCGRNDAPVPPAHSQSVAPTPPAASLLPAPSPVRPNASTGPAAGPRSRSSTRPPHPPCPAQVVPALGCADGRR